MKDPFHVTFSVIPCVTQIVLLRDSDRIIGNSLRGIEMQSEIHASIEFMFAHVDNQYIV